MGFIYKATYQGSGKAYIGQTTQPIEKRLEQHQYASSGCRAFYSAIQEHGWENFDVEWHEIPDEDLNFYEEMLVALLGTLAPGGYNLKEGGGNSGKMSNESKQKMSKSKSGEKNHNYGKTGEKHYLYGKEHTEETKKKISEAMSGKMLSEKTKKKMSDAKSGEKNYKSKKVYQYTLDGAYVDDFASSGEAARALGKTDKSSIGKCARGKRPSAYGFKWSCEKLSI
ncbi:GIY-YIG catalytic domain-containing endonuclease [Paramecium bursaria Chlorella virus NW665.2]|nr:GIY-YIG catalytic domain-containing endonuclease [Paramecium bursaria Chlorella virus NW665.2]